MEKGERSEMLYSLLTSRVRDGIGCCTDVFGFPSPYMPRYVVMYDDHDMHLHTIPPSQIFQKRQKIIDSQSVSHEVAAGCVLLTTNYYYSVHPPSPALPKKTYRTYVLGGYAPHK